MKLSHRFRSKLFKNSAFRLVELDVCCIAWTSLQKGKCPSLQVCSCTSPTTKRPPPYYPVGSAVSAGTQVWSCYYASLPSARNTMIKLKVSDRRCAPFSRFNYVQLLSAPAPRCCTSGVGYCSSVKRLFSTSVSITHSSWWLNNLGIHPGLSHPPPPQKKKKKNVGKFILEEMFLLVLSSLREQRSDWWGSAEWLREQSAARLRFASSVPDVIKFKLLKLLDEVE